MDFDPLVQNAWNENPSGLIYVLIDMQNELLLREKRGLAMSDLPKSVQDFFIALGSVKRTPGRPTKANAKLLAVQRAYERTWAHIVFGRTRRQIAFAKTAGMKEQIGGKPYPLSNDKPSDAALVKMAEAYSLSEDTIRDLVYPDRRK